MKPAQSPTDLRELGVVALRPATLGGSGAGYFTS